MAVWTIKSVSSGSPVDQALVGCRIASVSDGGGAISYRFLPATGNNWIALTLNNPPRFNGFYLGGVEWDVWATTTVPRNPPNGSTLSGRYSNNGGGARPGSDTGQWVAEV
jgi:hypothetical protein